MGNVLTNGAATTFTNVACGGLVPFAITTTFVLNANADSSGTNDFVQFRPGGSTIAQPMAVFNATTVSGSVDLVLDTDSSGNIQYRNSAALMETDIRVRAFQVHL